jgi:hypothetical protein
MAYDESHVGNDGNRVDKFSAVSFATVPPLHHGERATAKLARRRI